MIKAIETKYKGYRFRSRLEARWAVFFDNLGMLWEYENEGYDLQPVPFHKEVFYLQHSKLASPDELPRLAELSREVAERTLYYLPDFWLPTLDMFFEVKGGTGSLEDFEKMVRLCNGSGCPVAIGKNIGDPVMMLMPSIYNTNTAHTRSFDWAVCPICKEVTILKENRIWCRRCSGNGIKNIKIKESTLHSIRRNTDRAYDAARSARFEHGETPQIKGV